MRVRGGGPNTKGWRTANDFHKQADASRVAFNGHEVLPWDISRAEAAATLRRARSLRARGQATVSIEAVGRYRLSTFNTLILNTKRS